MENILQSIVKIIIIGSLFTTYTEGNRQFLPPPLPYYQNEEFYLPAFGPAYHDPLPVFYRAQNVAPPISYQNINPYTPPQLFHQNENYNPTQFSNPNLKYPVPYIFQQKPNHYEKFKPQKNDFVPPQTVYKKTPVVHTLPVEAPPKKPVFYATNIIVKEETHPPYYQDDYKNYHEEDYVDNYSDESPPPPEPCISSTPYRYFESPKTNPHGQKLTLCNPHFQPNFGNGIYTLKMPITLLPSRFPPRVEEFIERIQNYFSTYTEKETPKPQNITSAATTVQPVPTTVQSLTEVYTVTTPQPTVMSEQNKRNTTAEIEELSLEETNSQTAVVTTVEPITNSTNNNEHVTQKTIVVEIIPKEEERNTASSETQKTAQVETKLENINNSTETSQTIPPNPTTTLKTTEEPSENKISTEGVTEITTEKTEGQTPSGDPKIVSSTTEMDSEAKETTTVQSTNETLIQVTDTNG